MQNQTSVGSTARKVLAWLWGKDKNRASGSFRKQWKSSAQLSAGGFGVEKEGRGLDCGLGRRLVCGRYWPFSPSPFVLHASLCPLLSPSECLSFRFSFCPFGGYRMQVVYINLNTKNFSVLFPYILKLHTENFSSL